MTEQDTEEYEDLWTWFKALDAATDAARARIHATLASNRADGPTSATRKLVPPSWRGTGSGSRRMGRGLFVTS